MDTINELASYIKEMNNKFNDKYIIVDAKAKNTKTRFEAEKIVSSIISSGVPLLFALQVLSEACDVIYTNYNEPVLSTSDIRRAVRNSLHSLENFDISPQQCQDWGDTYVRKYGNPHGKIKIIHRDGRFNDLSLDQICWPPIHAAVLR